MSDAGALFDEIAYVAYHLGWPLDAVLDLEHGDRRYFADAVDRLNQRAGGGG